MYRRPKFLELLHEIREEMSREANFDLDVFAALVRNGTEPQTANETNEKPLIIDTLIDLEKIANQKSKI